MNLSRRKLFALFGGMLLTQGCARRLVTASDDPLRQEVEQELVRTKGVGMACAIAGPGRVWWSGVPLRLYGYANYPDGSLRTSVDELGRFLAAILAQGRGYHYRLLKPDTLALMFSGRHFGGLHLCWGTRRLPDGRSVTLHSGAEPGVTSFIAFESSTRIGVVCVRNFRVTKEDNTRLITLLLDAGRRMCG